MVTFALEASHLFRAGDKFQTQFFVMDIVNYLKRNFYEDTLDFKVVVLHGSTKDEQADRYTAALERFKVKVVRMQPIASLAGENKIYYKPTWYLHKMMGTEIPKGSGLMLIGFHHPRYITFLQKYTKDYTLSMASFTTPKRQGWMKIPEEFHPFLRHSVDLDDHVLEIKAEFKKKGSSTVI